ncbi:MAG: MFS transporter [Pseudomonadales bacterium]
MHSPPLSTSQKLSFGVGQIAEGIKSSAFGTFVLFYYNQVLGLAADMAGLAIALALIFDAVTDPIAGSVSDRWHGRLGRRHPFIYASALPLGLAFYLLFAPLISVAEQGQMAMFLWMLSFTVLTRGAMTLYYVPHMALGAELSTDYDERTVLVALRHFFGATGFILVYVIGFVFFFAPSEAHPNGQTNPEAYPPFAALMATLMAAAVFITAHGTRKRIPYLPAATPNASRVTAADVVREALDAMKSPSFRWMMVGFIIIIVAFGVAGATSLYMATFFWQLNQFQILMVLLSGPLGSMVGYAFSGRFFAWLDKRDAMIWGGFAWMMIHASPVLLYLAGLTPPPGTWACALFLTAITILAGATIGQLIVGSGTTMADIADEHELRTGRRQEGVFFGASAFAGKCSGALGSYLAGLVLAAINWPVGQAVRTAADIPHDTLVTLAIIAHPVSVVLAIPGLLCLRGYSLNREKLSAIQAALRPATDSATA